MKRLALLVLCIDACRTPTAMTVRVVSDVPCAAQRGAIVTAAGPSEYEGAAPTGRATRCSPIGGGLFDMGTIVLSPADDGSDRIGVRAVLGVARDAELCTAANNYAGCIVARRVLYYLPHTELTVELILRQECADVPCGPNTTCVGRVCRGAEIDPVRCESGCGEDVLSDRCDTPGSVECTGGKRVTCRADRTRNVESCGLSCSATTCVAASQVIAAGANEEGGGGTTCALVGGEVYCWGSNVRNRAGVASVASVPAPTRLPGLPRIVELAAGGTATQIYARDETGGLWCWGVAESGQCGAPEQPETVPRKMIDGGVARIATGSVFGCVITNAGDVQCAGSNGAGQLGRGAVGGKSATMQPIDRAGWSGRAVDISCMTNTCCLLDDAGAVACFGNNDQGQVGAGRTEAFVPLPTRVALDRRARALRGGDHTMCALLDDSGVACWGAPYRRVFIDNGDPQRTPLRLNALDSKEVVALATGMPRGHYAMTRSGMVLGWGTDGVQIGGVDNVPSLMGATSIGIASAHGCAIIAGGVQCWGDNNTGQLGDGSTGHPAPAPITWK